MPRRVAVRRVRTSMFRAVVLATLFAVGVSLAEVPPAVASAAVGDLPQQRSDSAANRPHAVPASATEATPGGSPAPTSRAPGAVPPDDRHQPAAPGAQVPPRTEVSVGAAAQTSVRGFDPQASREISERRDRRTQVFANPDGTQTARVYQDPTFYQRSDGGWAPIDSTLVADAGTWRNRADSAVQRFAASADAADVARYEFPDGAAAGFGLSNAAGVAGRVSGDTVTYPQVRSGADLTLRSTGTGIKEAIVLASKDAPTRWDFPLDLTGLSAKPDAGGIALVDPQGAVRARIPHGFMEDSAVDPHAGIGARSDGVTYTLDTSGARPVLRVSLDAAWLADPARVFPVTVDPTVTSIDAGGSTYVMSPYNNDYSADSLLYAGTYNGGGSIAASYLNFDAVSGILAGDYILGAKLWLYEVYSWSCTPSTVSVYPVTQPWPVGGLKSYPGPGYGGLLASADFAAGWSGSCPSAWEGIDLGDPGRNLIQGWTHGAANYGLTVRASTTDNYGWKKFASSNSANHPHLDVTYSPYWATYQPGSAMNPVVTPNQDGVLPVTVTNQGRDTWTPTNNYQLGYHIWDSAGNQLPDATATAHTVMPYDVPPGQTATVNATIKRLNPGTYTVRFDMDQYGTCWFSCQGVPMSGPVTITIPNAAPMIDSAFPPSDYDEGTLTPELFLTAHDPDGWPGNGIQYQFQVCDASGDGHQNCADSGLQSSPTWTVPAGKLSWGKSYVWYARVGDTVGTSPWSAPAYLTTVVPQPAITSHLAGASTEPDKGFDPGVGNYTTSVTDAVVKTVGPDLSVVRTYNSLDPRRTEAFGAGWSSRFDTALAPDQDGSGNVVVTYPDGQQVRFGLNPDGSYAPPRGRFATLTAVAGGGWKLTDKSATSYVFDNSGRLTTITDHRGRSETLTYGSDGKLSTVVSGVGGRTLHFTWSGGHVATVATDAVGATSPALVWSYSYTGDRLTRVCDPTNACTGYGYTTGSHFRGTVLDTNPQAYWRLADASGTSATNEVPPLTGTANGTYANVTLGRPGPLAGSGTTAGGFNGTSSSLQIPDHLVQASSYLAVELWFQTSSSAGGVLFSTANNLITDANPTLGAMPVLYVGTDGKLYGHFWNGQTNGIASANPVNNGAWHHVVLSGAGNTQTLYLDGTAVGTASGQLSNVDPHAYVGAGLLVNRAWPARPADNWGHFTGSISDVAFYAHPLGAPAVAEHYATRTAADELTGITQPSGNAAVALTYDPVHDRVTQYTDRNGGTWRLGSPSIEGDGIRYRDAVNAAVPDGDWRLAETSGTTAAGQTPWAYGTFHGTGASTTGPLNSQGGAHTFDGSTTYTQLPDNEIIGSDQLAVELWFKTSSTAGGVLFSTGTNLPTDANPTLGAMPVLYVGTDGKLYGHFWNGQTNGITSTSAVNNGAWHHVVLSGGNNSQTLYLDGAVVGTQAGQLYNADPHDYLGIGLLVNQAWPARPADNWGHFTGSIGEAALYQHTLDANTVAAHYAARTGSSAYLTAVYASVPHALWQLGDGGAWAVNEDQVAQGTDSNVGLAAAGPMRSSSALSFNGTSSYLRLPDSEVRGRTQLAVETWFQTSSAAGGVLFSTGNNLLTDANPTAGAMPVLYVGTDGRLYGHFWNGQVAGIGTATPVNDGAWHHVILSAAGNTQTLYLDGVAVGSQTGTLANVDPRTYVGVGLLVNQPWPARPADNWGHFAGSIGQFTVYHHPLDGATANDHHAARSSGSVVHVTDPGGHDVAYSFDLSRGGRLTNRTDATGAVRSFNYDTRGFLYYVVDENGHVHSMDHDTRGNMISQTAVSTTFYGYYLNTADPLDPRNDQVTAVRDGRSGNAVDNTYKTSYTYTTQGDLATVTTPSTPDFPNGRTTTNAYTAGTEPAVGGGNTPAGLLATVTDPRGGVTRYAYTASGDLAQVTDPAGKVTSYAYDGIGRLNSQTVVSATVPGGATTTYGYDGASRQTQILSPPTSDAVTGTTHQQRTTNVYDSDGNLSSSTVDDAAGHDQARTTGYGYDTHDRRTSVTDAQGGVTRYAFDVNGDRTQLVDAGNHEYDYTYTARNELATTTVKGFDGDGTAPHDVVLDSRAYDPAGRLASVTDAMGRTTTYTYFDDDRLAAKTLTGFHNPDGSTANVPIESYTYDPAGNRTAVYTHGGASYTRYDYDPAGRLSDRVLDPGGLQRKTAYGYDANSNPTTVTKTDAGGTRTEVTDYTYDALGRQLSQTVHNGAGTLVTTVARDQQGLPTAVTDPRGNVSGANPATYTTTLSYDPLGRVTRVTAPAVAVEAGGVSQGSQAPVSLTGYDTFGDVAERQDPNGNTTTTGYDKLGRPTTVTLPSYLPPAGGAAIQSVTTTGYDALGNVTSVTDPLGNTTAYGYDSLGDRTSQTDPLLPGQTQPGVSRASYDPDREQLSATNPTGAQSLATYDDLGRPITSTVVERSPAPTHNYTTNYAYTAGNDLAAVTTPDLQTTRYSYDNAHNPTAVTHPAGNAEHATYDLADRPTTVTDGLGNTTVNTYDLAGRPVTVTDKNPAGTALRTRSFGYDPAGNRTSATTGTGFTTAFAFDAANRLVSMVEPVSPTASITTSFGYDPAGNRTRYTDGNGNATITTVNPWNLTESTVEPATAATPNAPDRTYTTSYDKAGQPVTLAVPGGVTRTRTYDPLGHLTKETGTGAQVATPDRVLGYDLAGRLTSASTPTGTDTYTYDDRGDLVSTAGPSGTASFAYNAEGQMASRADASGTAAFSYDANNRLATATDPITGATRSYGYDAANQTTTIGFGANAARRTLSYDALHRLTGDTLTNSSGATTASIGYGYDLDDRLTTKTTTGLAGPTSNTYTYDQAGRLTSWNNGSTTTSYAWDNAGNRTQAGAATASYDQRNRLLSQGGTSYTYTPRGTQATRTTSGVTTSVTFDAFDRLAADGTTSYTYDALDRIAARGTQTFSYSGTGNDLAADGTATYSRDPQGGLLALAQGSAHTAALSDRHRDLVATFDPASGAVADSTGYDPFGQATAANHPLGYQGGYTDPSTGNVNMAARWYQPSTGTFASRDDIDLPTSPSVATNRYTYALGSPFQFIDPSGHDPTDDACAALSGIELESWAFVPFFVTYNMLCHPGRTAPPCASTLYDADGNPCPAWYRIHGYRSNGDWLDTLRPGDRRNFRPSTEPNQPPEAGGYGGQGGRTSTSGKRSHGGSSTTVLRVPPAPDWDKILRQRANTPAPRPADGPTIAPSVQKKIDDAKPAINVNVDVPSNNQAYQPQQADRNQDRPGPSDVADSQGAADRTILFHYTDEAGQKGILDSVQLMPSLKSFNPKDAFYGDGQYLSDIVPGAKSDAQLSRAFLGQPFQGARFTHYVAIDVTGLNVVKGRNNVFVIPNQGPLDLTGRIVGWGTNNG